MVLGMDRSGTSLCASVLQALGMSLGPDLLPRDRFNERGYFEDREIWRVHERLLAVLGRSWDTLAAVRPFPPLWWQSKPLETFREQLKQIAQARSAAGSSAIWGFKDPRTVLLLPLWKEVLQDLAISPTFVVCVRHPGAVAESLAARDGFPPLFSQLLWLEKTLTACLASWDAPNCLIHYEDWFIRPGNSIDTLMETTGLTPALHTRDLRKAVDALISSEMRHDTPASFQIRPRAAANFYGYLLERARVPEPTILHAFETTLAMTGELIAGVEAIAGQKLPCSIYPPSYVHCTDRDRELIQENSSGGTEFTQLHDPHLMRAALLLAERDAQLRDYAEALARAEALIFQRDAQLRDYAEALARAEALILQRDAELKIHAGQQQLLIDREAQLIQHSAALAQARALVQERDVELKRHVAALAEAQRLVVEREALLQRYVEGLAHAEGLVLERDAELKRHVDALAQAQRIVDQQNVQLREYDAALDYAQRAVTDRDEQLRHAEVLREQARIEAD
jgi:hypothetical protein